jgi:hypothetical protein
LASDEPADAIQSLRNINSAVGFSDPNDSSVCSQFDDVPQKIRAAAATGRENRWVG